MYVLPLIGVCYPNSPVFSLHSRRRAYGDKEKPLPILWATRYPCDKATSLQADRNVATLKLGPCETRRNRERDAGPFYGQSWRSKYILEGAIKKEERKQHVEEGGREPKTRTFPNSKTHLTVRRQKIRGESPRWASRDSLSVSTGSQRKRSLDKKRAERLLVGSTNRPDFKPLK